MYSFWFSIGIATIASSIVYIAEEIIGGTQGEGFTSFPYVTFTFSTVFFYLFLWH